MPEGPELAHSRDRLKRLIEGRAVIDFKAGPAGRYLKTAPVGLPGFLTSKHRVEEVGTHGKFMWWAFDTGWYLHCTYGMSGGWFTSPSKHTAAVVEYNGSGVPITRDSQHLFFNDPRHFGTLKFVKGEAEHLKKLRTLGPCILSSQVTPEIFASRMLGKPQRTLAEILMDQSCVAGVGNYLRAEILFDCKIDPWKKVKDLTALEYVKLREASINIAKASYESQGASIKTYKSVEGFNGKAQFAFKVYGKNLCPQEHKITRQKDGNGRMIHWCEYCQA